MIVKLKYIGTDGAYVMMIPNRDLTDYDIETITARDGMSSDELIEILTAHDNSLYTRSDEFYCNEPGCGKTFKSWKALNKHELAHIEKLTQSLEIAEEDNDNG